MSLIKKLLTEATETNIKQIFNKTIAQKQRGKPEQQMLRVHQIAGGGVMSVMVEHIGDITHRMTEHVTFDTAGYEFVKPKVEKGISYLNNGYSFNREFQENLKNNFLYMKENDRLQKHNISSLSRFKNIVYKELKKYAQEHEKIPVYNEMQYHARQSAVELGFRDFHKSLDHLIKLNNVLKQGKEVWIEMAHRYDPDFENKI